MRVCDKCGQKPAYKTMIMPRIIEFPTYHFNEIKDRETDICEDCYGEIAKMFYSC